MIDKRRMIQWIAIFLLTFGNFTLFGQTGPAGIGNSTSLDGHPHNLVWLDASDLSEFSTGNTWLDKSGNGHHAVSNGANLSLGTIGVEKALDFSAFTSGNFSIAHHTDFNDVDQLSIFVVYNSGTSTNAQGLVSKRTSTGNISFSLFQWSNYQLFADYINSTNRIEGAINTTETNYIGNFIFQSSDSSKIYKNGILDNSAWRITNAANINNTSAKIEIGKLQQGYDDANNFKGKIAEIIIYKSKLSPIQRALVFSYLSSKYGIDVQEVNLAYSAADDTYYEDLTGYARSSSGFKSFGSSAGFTISLKDASVGDYITTAHNGVVNNGENIKISPDVSVSGAVAAWNRNWYVQKGGTSTAKISFSFPEGIENGAFPQELSNYVLLRKDTPGGNYSQVNFIKRGIESGDKVWFEVADATFENGYYTLGTMDQSESPLEGGSIRTWYTLIGGDWDNWEVWTLDPSGALPNNPNKFTPTTSPTGASDRVVILNGKTVTVSTNGKQHGQVTVDGRLDLKATSGHDFTRIRGSGRILLTNNHFPAGDATHFTSAGQGEGTVVYNGNSFGLTQDLTFYNLEINLANVSDKITLLNGLTINGEFRVKNGEFQFNNEASTTALNVTVKGSVVVEENGKLLTGIGNARHQFNLYGDFTNNGSVAFTNRTLASNPHYNNEAIDGIVDVNFLNGSKNQATFLNGPSNFYRIKIDKGTDATYELAIEATQADYFKLLGYANQGHSNIAQLTGNTNALGLLKGTVRIKSNINIPVLNNTGNYNISEAARLWVDGGTVSKTSGEAIVPYGVVQVSAGTLNALVTSGITTRGNALVKVEGGTLNVNQLRTSTLGASNVGGYVQSGGITNVLGGSTYASYYSFNLTYPGNVFNMSGGTLHIHQANNKGGVFIASDAVNQNVTGGTVIMEINNGKDFGITSKSPFWNLIIRKSSGSNKHILANGVDVGTTKENLTAQSLRVLNDLTLEAGSSFDANHKDLSIGRNFRIEDNALYEFHKNTTTFNGTSDAVLYIGDITGVTNPSYIDPDAANTYEVWTHPFYNFVIQKPADKTLKFTTKGYYNAGNITLVKHATTGFKNINDYRSNLIKVVNDFVLESGRLDIDTYSLLLYGDITNKGVCGISAVPVNAQIKTRKFDAADIRVVTTTDNAEFGNLRLNLGSGILQFTSDVYIKRLLYKFGRINIGSHNLKVDKLVFSLNSSEVVNSNFSVEDMIIMDGNPSDGGLSLYVPGINNPGLSDPEAGGLTFDPNVYFFPIGTGTTGTYPESRYTPANIKLESVSDDGYVTVNVVSSQLQTAGPHPLGNDVLNKYFRIRTEGFTTLPKVKRYRLTVSAADLPDGINNTEMISDGTYNPAYVLDGAPYTRNFEINTGAPTSSGFQGSGEKIEIQLWGNEGSGNPALGFDMVNANYTAGVPALFSGTPTVFYSKYTAGYSGKYWDDVSSWSTVGFNGAVASSKPQSGDIVNIGYGGGSASNNQHYIKVRSGRTEECAVLNFVKNPNEGQRNGRVGVEEGGTSTPTIVSFGEVNGEGEFNVFMRSGRTVVVNGDFGNFAKNAKSTFMYKSQNNVVHTIPSSYPHTYPNLSTEMAGTFVFPFDVTVNGNFNASGGNILRFHDGLEGDFLIKGDMKVGGYLTGKVNFPNQGIPRNVTVLGNIEIGWVHELGYPVTNQCEISVLSGGTTSTIHTLKVGGDINIHGGNNGVKKGEFDLFTNITGGANVVLELIGETNNVFYNATATPPDLYRVVMNKGKNASSTFSFNHNFNLNGSTSGIEVAKALELQNGTLILNNEGININLTTGNDNFFIPQTAGLEVRQGKVNANGNSGILLDGKLTVSGGTVDMSGGNNYIQYSASGKAGITVSAGNLTVGSQIRRGLTSSEGVLNYTQTGGTVTVGNDAAPENRRGVFEVLNTGSNFTFTGGELQIARAQNNPAFASIYLAPATASTNEAALVRIGNDKTPANQTIGIYSTIDIPKLLLSNTSGKNPTLRQWTIPLTVSNLLTVEAGAVLDADGNDLILKGDFVSLGSFMPKGNTTFISGADDQELTGDLTFYNLTKTSSGKLSLNNSITIQNVFRHQAGLLVDNSNTVSVAGDLHMLGKHEWGGSGRGIVMNGTAKQMLYGSGFFGKLTTNNPEGIKVFDGNTVHINHALQMEQGVLDVGSNLIVLARDASIIEENPFSSSNMIITNNSFTDNGVKKFLRSGSSNFTFPVGSPGKYRPVKLAISANNNGTGSFLVKPAEETHPSILDENIDKVLNYHWVVRANGLSGFAAEARMKYDVGDVKGDISQYITARLLADGSGDWNKFSGPDVIDEINKELVFIFLTTNDAGISGDYTAGLDAAIPDKVPTYISKANGSWNDASIWDTYPVSGGIVPESGPRGSMVKVNHTVETLTNYTSSYHTTIGENGVLVIGSTYGHRLGEVFGSGVLSLERGDMPAGFYESFLSESGGTLRFGGNTNYDILSAIHQLNSLELVGSGERRFPNINVQMKGDLLIDGPKAINEQNKTISVKGDVVFKSGSFTAGTGASSTFVLNGATTQTLSGAKSFTGSNGFNRLTINNPAGVVFALNADVKDVLNLTAGRVIVNETAQFKIINYSPIAITGASSTNFIDGPLYKQINSGTSFEFPVGNKSRYGRIGVVNVSTAGMWRVQYHSSSPSAAGLSTGNRKAPVQYVSSNEYWNIEAPSAATAQVTLRWDAFSGVNPSESGLRGVQWITNKWHEVTLSNVSGSSSAGTAETQSALSFNANPKGNFITFGAITIPAYTWTGATSSDWFTPSNWTNSTVPSASANTTIGAATRLPEIAGATVAQVNNLTVETGATLTLNPGGKLTVNGDLTVTSNGELILKNTSETDGLASLITHGSVTGKTRVELTLPNNHWYYLSSPMKDVNYSHFGVEKDGARVYTYLSRQWIKYETPSVPEFKKLEGTLTIFDSNASNSETTISYSGEINTGTVSHELKVKDYYLFGNPYPASINWQDENWERNRIYGTIWYRTLIGEEMSFVTYNRFADEGARAALYPQKTLWGNDAELALIPPYQSVWIYSKTASVTNPVTLSVTPNQRIHIQDINTTLKSRKTTGKADVLRIMVENKSSRDGAVIYFSENATDGFDPGDSPKYFNSSARIPEVYTRSAGEILAINGLSPFEGSLDLPLSVRNRVEGPVDLNFDLSLYRSDDVILLYDTYLDAEINLRKVQKYRYEPIGLGDNHNRFVIRFNPEGYEEDDVSTPVDENSKENAEYLINIVGSNGRAIVSIDRELLQKESGKIEVFNTAGAKISEFKAKTNKTFIVFPETPGVYLVVVKAGGKMKSEKLIR